MIRPNVPQPLGPIHSSTPKDSNVVRRNMIEPYNASFSALMPNKYVKDIFYNRLF